jgi:hypothetical protein
MSASSLQNRPEEFDFHPIPIIGSPDHGRKHYLPSSLAHGDRSDDSGMFERVLIFPSTGRTSCGPLTRNLAGIPARLWESSEASTERSSGEGNWCQHP